MPQFNPDLFEQLIGDPTTDGRGRPFQWESAQRCPCFNPRTRSPEENCSRCGGFAYFYTLQEPPEGTTFFGGALGIMGDRRYAKMGEWMVGDMALTFSASLNIGDMDRITLLDAVHRQSDILIRGTTDTLIDRGVYRVLSVDDETNSYAPGVDFDLVGNLIAWKGHQPAVGTSYSVNYLARPVYVVWMQIPQDRTHVQVVQADTTIADRIMPKKVALRRWIDFVRNGGRDAI